MSLATPFVLANAKSSSQLSSQSSSPSSQTLSLSPSVASCTTVSQTSPVSPSSATMSSQPPSSSSGRSARHGAQLGPHIDLVWLFRHNALWIPSSATRKLWVPSSDAPKVDRDRHVTTTQSRSSVRHNGVSSAHQKLVVAVHRHSQNLSLGLASSVSSTTSAGGSSSARDEVALLTQHVQMLRSAKLVIAASHLSVQTAAIQVSAHPCLASRACAPSEFPLNSTASVSQNMMNSSRMLSAH